MKLEKCWFDEAKLGLFIYCGLYVLLEHVKGLMKRNGIPEAGLLSFPVFPAIRLTMIGATYFILP